MRPIVIKGAAAEKLSNLARAYRAIRAIVPTGESETTIRAGLLALLEVKRSQLRREDSNKVAS